MMKHHLKSKIIQGIIAGRALEALKKRAGRLSHLAEAVLPSLWLSGQVDAASLFFSLARTPTQPLTSDLIWVYLK